MKEPKVSIIIPTYNVERYIEECIESVLNQSYTNIEVIIIDDGSTDSTKYLLKDYEDRTEITYNQRNQGQGVVRNQGVRQATGSYILFVDADDWIEPFMVSELVQTFEKADVDLIRFNGKAFQTDLNPNHMPDQYTFNGILEEGEVYQGEELLEVNRKSFSASPCLYITKKEVIEENNVRFAEEVIHEDELFTTHLFVEISSMAYINKGYYHRRYRVSSTMTELTNPHRLKSFDSYIEVYKELENLYEDSSYSSQEKQFIKRQMISIYNGLLQLDVPSFKRKALKDLKYITLKDKLHIQISNFRQRLNN